MVNSASKPTMMSWRHLKGKSVTLGSRLHGFMQSELFQPLIFKKNSINESQMLLVGDFSNEMGKLTKLQQISPPPVLLPPDQILEDI